MKSYRAVYMRGGTSKGLVFHREDLPPNQDAWDDIFLQAMGSPDPKQIDGLGGTVSSSNKVVVVWPSDAPDADVEYLVGQVIVGKRQVDYKSNCGNMTACVGPFAVEEGLVPAVEPLTDVRLLNRNTDKRINVSVPVEDGTFARRGDCRIAGVDGTAAELKVNFLDPAGAKTGVLLPTGNPSDLMEIPGLGSIAVSVLDVSNPMVLVAAEDIGLTATELPEEINADPDVCDRLERIRGAVACRMGFAKDLEDATANSPAVPKVGFFTLPKSYRDLSGGAVNAADMDVCVRVISVFKCHKACPLTSASALAVAAMLPGTIVHKMLGALPPGQDSVRIGHPSGVMTVYPQLEEKGGTIAVPGVAIARTARRIMDGTVYITDPA